MWPQNPSNFPLLNHAECLSKIATHIWNLKFSDKPNYELLKSLFEK